MIGLTKAVAADFVTQGIRCNAICPDTKLCQISWSPRPYSTLRIVALRARQPLSGMVAVKVAASRTDGDSRTAPVNFVQPSTLPNWQLSNQIRAMGIAPFKLTLILE